MLRRLLPVLAAALLLAGCGADRPEVGFAAGDGSVTARPTQYCDIRLTDCEADANAPVTLAVPAGTPLRISVPQEVSSTPWTVVFSYRNAAGEQVDQRSKVFSPDERSEYVLQLPDPGDRLLTAEVQQMGVPQTDPQSGEVQFPARASWVLRVAG